MSRLLLCLSALLLSTFSRATPYVLPDDCLEFDIGQLEDYLSTLNLENVPRIDTMIGGFKCPVTALPFGALKSDWARLLLLQNAQPRNSILPERLGRLFRILIVAYFRMEERFDIAEPGVGNSSSVNLAEEGERKECNNNSNSTADSRGTNEVAGSFANITSSTTPFVSIEGSVGLEQTTFTSIDTVTISDKSGNSDTIFNNVASTAVVTFSPVDVSIDERNSITDFMNVTISPTIDSRTQKDRNAQTSTNYRDDNDFSTEILKTNFAAEGKSEINGQTSTETNSINFSTSPNINTQSQEYKNTEKSTTSLGTEVASEIKDENVSRAPTTNSNFREENTADGFVRSEKFNLNENKNDQLTETVSEFVTLSDAMKTSSALFNSPSTTFSVTRDTLGTTTESEKSITRKVKAENGTDELIRKSDLKNSRGDFPSSNFASSLENRVDDNGELDFPTMRYHDSNFAGTKNGTVPFDTVKTTTGQSRRVYSDKSSENDVVGSTETFNQNLSNRPTDDDSRISDISWDSWNSTVPSNKIRKLPIHTKAPAGNQFWKYIVASRRVTSTGSPNLETEKADRGKEYSPKFKKRGSLNTDRRKSFRWFYNFFGEGEKHFSKDSGGIYIECAGKKRNTGGE